MRRLAGDAGHREHPAAAKRADQAPMQVLDQGRIDGGRGGRGDKGETGQNDEGSEQAA